MKDIKDEISLLYNTESLAQNTSNGLLQKQMRVLENLQATGREDSVVALAPLLDRKTALSGYVRKTIIELVMQFNARDYLALEVRVRESLWSHCWSYQPVHAMPEYTSGTQARIYREPKERHRYGFDDAFGMRTIFWFATSA